MLASVTVWIIRSLAAHVPIRRIGRRNRLVAPGRKRKSYRFLVLAVGLLVFAAVAGTSFLILRPTTLRIAVGPSGSEDQNLVQALAQSFDRDGSPVRLALVTSAGPVESLPFSEPAKPISRSAGPMRTCPRAPSSSRSAQERRGSVVAFRCGAQGGQEGSRKRRSRDRRSRGSSRRRRRPDRSERQAAPRHPHGIRRQSRKSNHRAFNSNQIAEMVHDPSIDAFMTVGPLESKITLDAIVSTARFRGEPTFLPIDVSEAIARRHPLYESEEIPGSSLSSSPARPDDTIETIERQSPDRRAAIPSGKYGRGVHPAAICGPPLS